VMDMLLRLVEPYLLLGAMVLGAVGLGCYLGLRDVYRSTDHHALWKKWW